jgi:hypothetical protein
VTENSKRKSKQQCIFSFFSGDKLTDIFHMVLSFYGFLWPRTIAMAINYQSSQRMNQETLLRLKKVAIDISNHTPGKNAKMPTFCVNYHLSVYMSNRCDIIQYVVCYISNARYGAFTSKYWLVSSVGDI